ncbi:GlcNAc-PI de-N-acetylase [Pollutimonas bauzanensis]|uniref:GlcNAc-PI de-N-acetylase n=2 Tax=Pollutimonas bauzanensis TaxID=658167 RepID=A0A1M5WFZ2_9BURK|nr:GlcNAc-PI de-N-acetylase [Pollutimonas bauzanensis]
MAGPSLIQCHGMKDLVFVPHQDDDLLFMNPDIGSTIDAGGCVQVVYLTASERGEGEGYMLGRERGVRAAYAYMAQEPNIWAEGYATIGTRRLARFTLNGNKRVRLLHMRLKDPWLGKGWGSLTPLSRAESVPGSAVESLGPAVETYTRPELVATIRQIIQEYQPSTIRHMDDSITIPYADLCWRCIGHDHPDHIASARLVHEAIAQEHGNYAEVAYVDYPSQERVANLSPAETVDKTDAFRRYAWDDYRYCTDRELCREPAGPAAAWVGRSYYVSRHNVAPAILPDLAGGFVLFAAGEANCAANVWQSAVQRWASLGGRTADPIAAFDYRDGRAGVFARDATGLVWANTQGSAAAWQGWQLIPGGRFISLPAASRQGPLLAVAMGNDGFFHYTQPAGASSAWTPWLALPPLPGALPGVAVAADSTGAPAIFAADSSGGLWVSSYLAIKNPPLPALPIPGEDGGLPLILSAQVDKAAWTAWRRIPAPDTDDGLAALRNADGLIELYLRDKATGHMQRIVQASPGNASAAWSRPTDLGVTYAGKPAVALNEKGAVAVAAMEHRGGALWLLEAGQATRLAASVASIPALGTMHGVLYVAARSADAGQAYWVRARRQGAWGDPVLVGPPPAGGGGAFSRAQRHAALLIEPFKASVYAAAARKPATLAVNASVAAAPLPTVP